MPTVSVILLDIVLPKVDGFMIMEHIQKKGLNITVIAMSNMSEKHHMDRSKALGAKEYIVKSDVLYDDVIDMVARYMM